LKITDIIKKAVDGGEINDAELRELFMVDYLSEEAFLIAQAGRHMSEVASKGKAEVHAQVGVNSGSCGCDCEFCSFASIHGIFKEPQAKTTDEVIEGILEFEQSGANAVYMLTTAKYDFGDFIKLGTAVKSSLSSDIPLIANIGDFDDIQAAQLKAAGFTGIYHAIRLGEGVHTRINPKMRWRTVEAAHNAGLVIGTCLEPVGPEHSVDELVEKTMFTRKMNPAYSGAGRRVPIAGTAMAEHGLLSFGKMALIVAAVRLAMGYGVVGNCTHEPNGIGAMVGTNIMWAECGSNPRDTEANTVRGLTVDDTFEFMTEAGWKRLQGASAMYVPR